MDFGLAIFDFGLGSGAGRMETDKRMDGGMGSEERGAWRVKRDA
jgi:hypothetical protein